MTTTRSYYDQFKVDVPEGESGNVKIVKFEVVESDRVRQIRDLFTGRDVPPGEYTKLTRNGRLWMSDTPAEWRDNAGAFYMIQKLGGRILINGLGLGMIVKAALTVKTVTHIDVVEIDQDVINLVGPTYAADPRVVIHHADAYEQMKQWPRGTRWTVAWHDIWPDVSEDDRKDMTRFLRSYGRRVDWQDCWGRELIERNRWR